MPMTSETFKEVHGELQRTAVEILALKGPDYAGHGEDNRLANFETIAELLRGAPVDAVTVCAIYWLKHVFAICSWVRTRKEGSEPTLGRFADERNYNALLWACRLGTDPLGIGLTGEQMGRDLARALGHPIPT